MENNSKEIITKRYMYLILASYIFLGFIFSRLYDSPSIIKSIFGLSLFLILPLETGTFILFLLRRLFNLDIFDQIDFVIRNFFKWVFGIFVLFIIALILYFLHIFNIGVMSIILFSFCIANIILSEKKYIRIAPQQFKIIILISILSLIFSIYFVSYTPFPLGPSWDHFVYGTIAERMIEFNEFHLFTEDYSPTMYLRGFSLPIFHLNLSISSFISNSYAINIFWPGVFMLSLIYSLSIFRFIKYFLRSNIAAIIGVIIGLWALEFSHVNGLSSLVSSSLLMLIFPSFIIWVDKLTKNQENKKSLIVLIFFSLLLLIYS